jgi:predicted nucleic acid-binding protein
MKRSIRAEAVLVEAMFVDTWGWLVLADARDPAHVPAVAERRNRSARGGLVTTDYVLDETFTRLFARCGFPVARQFSAAVLEAAAQGQLRLERITPPRFDAAYQMRLRYRDKPNVSFTDFTSVIVMRELGLKDVLTADAHFAQVQLGFRRVPDAPHSRL